MKIGNIEFCKYPVFLAPLEDVTDKVFRYLCKEYGADMMYTEFVSSEALIRDVKRSIQKMEIFDYERPIGIQIYGNKIESMVEAAKLAEQLNPDLIDLNYGCPVKKIASKGGGAGLLKDIPKMVEMTDKVVKATKLPVTAKTRLGWDESNKNIVEIAERLQDVGIKAITIHGRTRTQMYKGEADWTLIGEVKNNQRMKIPVIGNGDINNPEIALEMFNKYGVDAIMVGRASIGKPYIFKEIKHFLETGEKLPKLSTAEQVELLKIHVDKSIEYAGLPRGIIRMRRHMALSFKGLPHFRELRIKMLRCEDYEELIQIFNQISEKYSDY